MSLGFIVLISKANLQNTGLTAEAKKLELFPTLMKVDMPKLTPLLRCNHLGEIPMKDAP